MAAPTVTYTFINGATSDGPQVSQNFADLIASLSDGTKDISVSTVTTASKFLTANGTIGAPSYSFTGDTSSGMYSAGAGSTRFSNSGVAIFKMEGSYLVLSVPIAGQDGSGTAPPFTNVNEPTWGLYRSGGGQMAFVSQNVTATIFLVNPQTANANAGLRVVTAGVGTGDSYINFAESGSSDQWTLGRDDSDTGAFVICQSSSALGTNTFLKIDTGGVVTIGTGTATTHVLNTLVATTATAGAQTLPANPQGFIAININGTARKIPYYAT